MDIAPVVNDQMPKAIGPYSHAFRAGDLPFVAGQPGLDPETGQVAEVDFEAEARQAFPHRQRPGEGAGGDFEAEGRMAFPNLQRVVEAAGLRMSRVVKTTVFLADAELFPAMNVLFAEFFPADPPTRATPIVALPRGLRISIEAI